MRIPWSSCSEALGEASAGQSPGTKSDRAAFEGVGATRAEGTVESPDGCDVKDTLPQEEMTNGGNTATGDRGQAHEDGVSHSPLRSS